MSRDVIASINLSSARHNAVLAQSLAPASRLMAVVKSDAYGHGVVPFSRALEPVVSGFGVAHLEEALALRTAGVGVDKVLLILEGPFCLLELEESLRSGIEVVLHCWEQIEWLERFSRKLAVVLKPQIFWLKVNTGLNRLGFEVSDLPRAYESLQVCSLVSDIVVTSHFANADSASDSRNIQQIERFRWAMNSIIALKQSSNNTSPQLISLSNSGGVLHFPEVFQDWVRPGLILYGISPAKNKQLMDDIDIRPVMTLTAKVIAVRSLEVGEQVGYGGYFTADRVMRIAVIGIGYGDGYPWSATPRTTVFLNGCYCPVVGCISMDMLTVDISQVEAVRLGDTVELWGDNVTLSEVAKENNTIPYELLCRLTPRVQRAYTLI